ncbi:hypothetical protein BsWGS_10486 [Bradybaena similaris]
MPEQNLQIFRKTGEDLEKMGTSLIGNAEKVIEKDRESRLQPRREVNSSMSGSELISENEQKLCNSMDVSPENYVAIKTFIIKDYFQMCSGKGVGAHYHPGRADNTFRHRIIAFEQDHLLIGAA